MKNLLKLVSFFSIFALIVLIGCVEKSELQLSHQSVNLLTGDSLLLEITPSVSDLVYESSNPLIVDCKEGVIKAMLEGEVIIKVSSQSSNFSAQCAVKVAPRFTHYREPVVSFGISPNVLKSRESRSLIHDTIFLFNNQQQRELFYEGENKMLLQATYVFLSSRLNYVYLLLNQEDAESIVQHIEERFLFVEATDDALYYLNPVPPNKAKTNEFILVSYQTFIDESDPSSPNTYISVDYQLVDLSQQSLVPASLRQATKEYIKGSYSQNVPCGYAKYLIKKNFHE